MVGNSPLAITHSYIKKCSFLVMFDQTMYTVPENNRTVPLCIDIGLVLTEPTEFTVTSKSKTPPDAQGKSICRRNRCIYLT